MRRWLPRSLWLLAWSFWAWLGFGLYRELPRGSRIERVAQSSTILNERLGKINTLPPHVTEEIIARLLAEERTKEIIEGPAGANISVMRIEYGDAGPGRFGQREYWRIEVGRWSHEVETYAVRRSSDESLQFRLWNPPVELVQDGEMEPHTRQIEIVMSSFGNSPLLALCQTILALPLVLLWAGLRWRRKRRMGMAS
jgi:hypothetical protein